METRIERKIQQMLRVGKSSEEVFDELTVYLFHKKISDSEKDSIINFAANAGLDQQLMSVLVDMFHEKQTIPWHHFIHLTAKHGLKPSKAVIESVLKGVKKQENHHTLALTLAWDQYDHRFSEIRDEISKQRREEFSQKKSQLMEKLNFYRYQRMFADEEKLLKIMSRMYPQDPQIKDELIQFKENQAYEVISRNSGREMNFELATPPPKPSKEDQKFLVNLKTFILEVVKKEKRTAYNFAILFKLIGQPRIGLEVIRYAPVSKPVLWLEIDLLLEAGQDVNCLDKIHEIEVKFSDDPETTFAATYARAKALHHLGQNGKAIDLLKSIVEVRPDYRSANSLLSEWAQQWM